MAEWKEFKESKGLSVKKITTVEKEILKSHIILSEDINDYDVVQLVMLYNNKSVDAAYVEKFKAYGYINENKKFTKEGNEFLKSEDTLSKIKKIIADN